MKRYVKANHDGVDREFNYEMLKPLIHDCTEEYFDLVSDFADQEEEPEYDFAVDFITQHVQSYLEDFTYEDFEEYVKMYLDTNYDFIK